MPNPSTTARSFRNNHAFQLAARLGFAVNGVLHIAIGAIAAAVAFGNSGEADQSGALGQLAHNPVGMVVLWLLVVGLWALGLFLLVSAIAGGTKAKDRVSDAAKAIAYLAVGATAFTFARGGSSSSTQQSTSVSAKLLSAPAGVLLLVVLGLAVVAVGVYFVAKGARKKFLDDLSSPSGPAGRGVEILGVVGYVAKGVAIGVVGILFVVAALTTDAQKASGLDGALKSLAGLPFGVVILLALALGFVAYGIYCFARARWARL